MVYKAIFLTSSKFMVGTTGFEPATPASRMQCSTRLSHVPTPLNYRLFAFVSRDQSLDVFSKVITNCPAGTSASCVLTQLALWLHSTITFENHRRMMAGKAKRFVPAKRPLFQFLCHFQGGPMARNVLDPREWREVRSKIIKRRLSR